MEIWKPLPTPDYIPNEYEVSNTGKLRSTRLNRIMCCNNNGKGYRRICIQKNSKEWRKLLHVAVAELFVGPRPTPLHEVNHIDGNTLNNNDWNLEWLLHAENIIHAMNVLGRRLGKGSIQVLVSKDEYSASFPSITAACKALKLVRSCAQDVVNGKQPTHHGYKIEKLTTA